MSGAVFGQAFGVSHHERHQVGVSEMSQSAGHAGALAELPNSIGPVVQTPEQHG